MTEAMSRACSALHRILRPITPEAFLGDIWDQRSLHIPGDADKLADLSQLFGYQALERLLHRAQRAGYRPPQSAAEAYERFNISCAFSAEDYVRGNLEGQPPTVYIHPDQVGGLRTQDATFRFFNIHLLDPKLEVFLGELRQALSWAGLAGCHCWLSTQTSGLTPHFDGAAVIQIQLSGQKAWQLGRRVALPWPRGTAHLQPDGGVHYLNHGLEGQPWEYEAMAGELDDVLMTPGDVLYVPAGCFHSTRPVGGESLALSFAFRPRPFVDLLSELAGQVLGSVAEQRAIPPWQPTRDGALPAEVLAYTRDRLKEVRALIDRLEAQPEQLAQVWNKGVTAKLTAGLATPMPWSGGPLSPETRLQSASGVVFRLMACQGEGGEPALNLLWGSGEITFDDPSLFGFARGLAGQGSAFVAGDAQLWSEGPEPYPWDDLAELLAQLMEAGLLIREFVD